MTTDPHNPPGGFDALGLPVETGNESANDPWYRGIDMAVEEIDPLRCRHVSKTKECPGCIENPLLPSVCVYCDQPIVSDLARKVAA